MIVVSVVEAQDRMEEMVEMVERGEEIEVHDQGRAVRIVAVGKDAD